jgi:hypothetical protein
MWQIANVTDGFARLLRLEQPASADVVEALIGTRRTRFGPRPTLENEQFLRWLVDTHMLTRHPIPILLGWGAAKCYGQFRTDKADLFDLMALKRLAELQADVQLHYPPGVKVTLLWEDWTERELAGRSSLNYHLSMLRLINGLGLVFVDLLTESLLVPADDEEFRQKARSNATAICHGHGASVGWRGDIDWHFYVSRAATEHPGEHAGDLRRRVAHYLGIALARYQFNILPRGSVRLSFCPYPGSTPAGMRRGRVEWKVKPSPNSNKGTPPWVGFGVVRECGDWSHIGVREAREQHFRHDCMEVNGVDIPFLRV